MMSTWPKNPEARILDCGSAKLVAGPAAATIATLPALAVGIATEKRSAVEPARRTNVRVKSFMGGPRTRSGVSRVRRWGLARDFDPSRDPPVWAQCSGL